MKTVHTYIQFSLVFFAAFVIDFASYGQQVYISSRNGHAVRLYDLETGNFIREFVTPGSGGLSFPQEVVWHPKGFLLVTGRGNTAIKKYDGSSGDYLGNFTSGYQLDNPTKTTLGMDGLIYVSQWGITQNKVVRFNLDGEFVDEYTSIGIPAGSGHAWDAQGNFYVAQYGNGTNGRVLRFDQDGIFLNTFIPTGHVQGPVNLWFDDSGNLFVADWTKGDVIAFDGSDGTYQSSPITSLQNIEGYDFDNNGLLYVCDWTGNAVYRYDFETKSLSQFIHDPDLAAPNSILIREASSATVAVDPGKFNFQVSPNPASDVLHITYHLPKATNVRVDLLDTNGVFIANMYKAEEFEGKHSLTLRPGKTISPGVYLVQLHVGKQISSIPVAWQ